MLVCVYNFDLRRRNRYAQLAYWTFFVVLVIIAGLRYRLGTDSVVYEGDYEEVPKLWELGSFNFNSTRFEPGFIVIQSLTRSFSPDFMWFQFLHAIIVNLVIFWFINKNTPHKFLGIFFYFIILYLNLNMQVMRESIAVALFLLSWPLFRDGKWIYYYILVGLSTFFHTSAFLLLIIPLFCLPGVREFFVVGKRTVFICLAILLIGIFIQSRFASVFNMMAVTQRMMDRVHAYANDSQSGNFLNIKGMVGQVIQFCLYPLLSLYYGSQWVLKKKRKKALRKDEIISLKEDKENLEHIREAKIEKRRQFRWQIIVLLGVYFMIFSIPMFIFRRYFNYFGIFCLVAVATWSFSVIRSSKKKIRLSGLTWILILLPYLGLNLYSYMAPASKGGTLKVYHVYYPYESRLDPKMDSDREAIYRYLNAR